MAAVTVANLETTVWGNKRVVRADLTVVADGNTWATGLSKIDQVIIGPSAAAATTQIGYTVSGGTVTFKVESGSLAGQFTAIGV